MTGIAPEHRLPANGRKCSRAGVREVLAGVKRVRKSRGCGAEKTTFEGKGSPQARNGGMGRGR